MEWHPTPGLALLGEVAKAFDEIKQRYLRPLLGPRDKDQHLLELISRVQGAINELNRYL